MAIDTSRRKDNQDLEIKFLTDKSPDQVFKAINNVRAWWSGDIVGDTDKLGLEWTYRYQDIHYSKQKIVQLDPNRKVVWQVIDSYIQFVENKTEWTGTNIIFEVKKVGDKTELKFNHKGLVPTLACYKECAQAWKFYIRDSLRKLIITGKGRPNK
jgi:hypothetical protein